MWLSRATDYNQTAQHQNYRDYNNQALISRNNNFDNEKLLIPCPTMDILCQDFGPLSSVSSEEFPEFWSLVPENAGRVVDKTVCPVRQPVWCPELSVGFYQSGIRCNPETLLCSGATSFGSSSYPSFASDDDDVFRRTEHGDLSSFRELQETTWNMWSSNSGPHMFPQNSLQSLEFDASLDYQMEGSETIRHPSYHLPPTSTPSRSMGPSQSKWKKGRLLGSGAFGNVYAGFNSENGQMCAIKEVRVVSDDKTSKQCLKQLNQEIAMLSKLSHPNIVRYYGSEMKEDRLSVLLEYVSGGSINKLLGEYGPFQEQVIQSYTSQLLDGLAYLHRNDTVHRDIKGANILVDPNGEIKLADFGLAKNATPYSSGLSFKGSPYWMAPEVIMNGNGSSLAADIWSLGCTVLEMATSKPPWSQYEDVAAIFKIAMSKSFPDIPSFLSRNAQNFVKQCLQRDPSARPTAAQLLRHPFIRDQV